MRCSLRGADRDPQAAFEAGPRRAVADEHRVRRPWPARPARRRCSVGRNSTKLACDGHTSTGRSRQRRDDAAALLDDATRHARSISSRYCEREHAGRLLDRRRGGTAARPRRARRRPTPARWRSRGACPPSPRSSRRCARPRPGRRRSPGRSPTTTRTGRTPRRRPRGRSTRRRAASSTSGDSMRPVGLLGEHRNTTVGSAAPTAAVTSADRACKSSLRVRGDHLGAGDVRDVRVQHVGRFEHERAATRPAEGEQEALQHFVGAVGREDLSRVARRGTRRSRRAARSRRDRDSD